MVTDSIKNTGERMSKEDLIQTILKDSIVGGVE